jgi:hypothetical protein
MKDITRDPGAVMIHDQLRWKRRESKYRQTESMACEEIVMDDDGMKSYEWQEPTGGDFLRVLSASCTLLVLFCFLRWTWRMKL